MKMKIYVLVKVVSGQCPEIIDSYNNRNYAEHCLAVERANYERVLARWSVLDDMRMSGIDIGAHFMEEYMKGAAAGIRSDVEFKILTARG